jgi:hypothetical protein
MYYELSKPQKKIARKVMDKGLDNHYIKALLDVKSIIAEWEKGSFDSTRDAYMKLFTTVDNNNNNISLIYDNKGGSRWVEVMGRQLSQGVITMEDIIEFDCRKGRSFSGNRGVPKSFCRLNLLPFVRFEITGQIYKGGATEDDVERIISLKRLQILINRHNLQSII